MIGKKVKRRHQLIVILLAILFGGASLTNLGNSEFPLDPAIVTLRLTMIGIVIFFVAIVSGQEVWNIPTKPAPLTFLWMMFSFVMILSGVANNDPIILRDGFWFLIAIPLFFFNTLPKLMKKSANILITLGLLLGVSPYIIISLILHPVWQSDSKLYSGIFPNSNQLGFTTTILSSSLFILIIGFLSAKKSSFESFMANTSLVACLTIILLSNARTALIAFSTMSLLMFWKIFQNTKNIFITAIFGATISITIFFLSAQNPWLFERISEIQDKDALSGRDDIWVKTFLDMKLLGNGEQYFEANFSLGAHNTIVHILGVNGLIAAILMVIFAVISFYYAVLYFKKHAREDPHAIAPLVFMTCFWTLSMGEGMFGSLGNAMTLAYMLSIGVIIADSNAPENLVTAITIVNKNSINK